MRRGKLSNIFNAGGIEIAVVILYMVLFIIVSFFHEPWFDEAQAWEIGKTATYREIMTVLPHTEGHPPLWSLILSVPAKLGVPYLIGLKGISLIFSVLTVLLIVFKSPFPKVIRYILPFTYFFFYQYGVISRTYCVLELSCVLIAMSFKNRKTKPCRFAGGLYLLCLTSIYGILIAGGISICWLLDIIAEYRSNRFRDIHKDIRLYALLVLLVAVLPVVYLIIPFSDVYALGNVSNNYLIRKLLYFIFVLPGDTFISVTGLPTWETMGIVDTIPGLITTLFILGIIILISKRRDIKYYIVPYLFYILFMCFYGSGNHTGIGMIWLCSYIWAVYDISFISDRCLKIKNVMFSRLGEKDIALIVCAFKVLPIVIVAFSAGYCMKICIDDVRLPYSESKAIADFIKEHNMENAAIMISWDMRSDAPDNVMMDYDYLESENTLDAVAILPYFDDNIFFNHNARDHRKGYASHLCSSKEENLEAYRLWHACGIPEVLVGTPALKLVYDDEISLGDYVDVAEMKGYYMGKNKTATFSRQIYVRKDCLKKFGIDGYDI